MSTILIVSAIFLIFAVTGIVAPNPHSKGPCRRRPSDDDSEPLVEDLESTLTLEDFTPTAEDTGTGRITGALRADLQEDYGKYVYFDGTSTRGRPCGEYPHGFLVACDGDILPIQGFDSTSKSKENTEYVCPNNCKWCRQARQPCTRDHEEFEESGITSKVSEFSTGSGKDLSRSQSSMSSMDNMDSRSSRSSHGNDKSKNLKKSQITRNLGSSDSNSRSDGNHRSENPEKSQSSRNLGSSDRSRNVGSSDSNPRSDGNHKSGNVRRRRKSAKKDQSFKGINKPEMS